MLRHDPLYPPRLVCSVTSLISLDYTDMRFSLTTWLSHSKKKSCDVCKHPYSFTKGKVSLVNPGPAHSDFPPVYANDMPRDLPVILLLRKLAQQVVFACFFCIRAIIVSFVWLAILPWVVFLSWRVYFSIGNYTYVTVTSDLLSPFDEFCSALWISARPGPPSSSSTSSFFYNLTSRSQSNSTATNTTLRRFSNDTDSSTLDGLLAHPLLRTVSTDIFTGQIIATAIVLIFIAVFLLREWISQNARPGVFEEGDPAADPDPEQEPERQQQRFREQARAIMEQRENQLRRRQQAEVERLPRARGDLRQLESSRRHPDQSIRDLPPSRRAQELHAAYAPQTTQPDQVGLSASDTAGPSSAVSPIVRDDQKASSLQVRQEWSRAAEIRRHLSLRSTSSPGELRASDPSYKDAGPSAQSKSTSYPVPGSDKGKARAIDFERSINQDPASINMTNDTASALSTLKQKRTAWGIPGAESWTLYDFERFEMTRLGIDLMFSPHGVVAETDPCQLIVQAQVDDPIPQDGPTSSISAGFGTYAMAAPDDWTECLGDAVDDAWRWRARRRVLWERLREEAERDGLAPLQVPHELSGISIEELHMVQDIDVWTPPPAPKLISRLPVLTTLPPTPSHPAVTDDGMSLLSAHKRLRAEGSRAGRSFTISTVSIVSPDEDDGSPRRVRQRTQSQADSKTFSFAPFGEGDAQPFPYNSQNPLPFPITPTVPPSREPLAQYAGSAPLRREVSPPSFPSSPAFLPLDSQPSLAPALSIPRRPPMPNTTIPTPTSAPPSLLPRDSVDNTPLGSPSLATYQPPEEFQEGSARQGYFDGVEEGEGELDCSRNRMNHERFERDAALFFKGEPLIEYNAGKEARINTEEEEEEEEEDGDLPGLLADSDEDGDDEARVLRGAARRGQRRAAWGPEWGDAVPAEVADEGDIAVEADDDGEDAEGDDVEDAALAAQLADEDMVVEDDMEGALEGKVFSRLIWEVSSLTTFLQPSA
jgi:hypothetical protein